MQPPSHALIAMVIDGPLLTLATFLKSLGTIGMVVSLPEILVLAQACCQIIENCTMVETAHSDTAVCRMGHRPESQNSFLNSKG